MKIRWTCLHFDELGLAGLYALMQQRQQVFILEQHCAYQDADGADPQAHHQMAWGTPATDLAADRAQQGPALQSMASLPPVLHPGTGEHLLASARILPPGLRYPQASIGRVITAASVRGTGLGRELMLRSMQQCRALYPGQGIAISAQAHLEGFYGALGFAGQGDVYDEDGIPHLKMLAPAS